MEKMVGTNWNSKGNQICIPNYWHWAGLMYDNVLAKLTFPLCSLYLYHHQERRPH